MHKTLSKLSLTLLSAAILSACNQADQASSAPEVEKIAQQTADTNVTASATTEMEIEAESKKANEMYDRFFEAGVARSPQALTFLGRKERMGEWNDLSDAFAEESLAIAKQNLQELETLDKSKLDAATALSYDLLKQNLENQIEDHKWRLYNYPVNQMFGAHTGTVSLLINQHRINNVADAEAYVQRLEGMQAYFDQLSKNIDARAKANIVPPKFVFPHVIRDSKNIIKGAPFDDGEPSTLLTDFSEKLNKLEAKEGSDLTAEKKTELLASATKALLESVKPAYQKLITHLTELEKTATTDDGVWKWKDGNTYFNVALKRTTTTDLTAEEIHEIGLKEVARIHDEMRAIKDKVGFEGDLKEFMQFMRTDKQFYYLDGQAGKDRYLKEAVELIDDMKGRLDELFTVKPKADIIVKAVEPFREQSAGKAFYQRPSEDGTRPGIYYANLYNMEMMPTYQMAALAYHEGIPGHHMQLAIQQELQGVPKFRRFGGYTAYSEGWGLYTELVPKEIGLYADPYSDFGRLAMELWRACRLVVDTGIHTKKWTREDGIKYYMDNTPNAELDAIKMVERHIVMPSQATAYKIGMLKILELREKAKTGLGEQFDIRGFHDTILENGPLPLNVLETKINEWIASKQG